MAILDIREDEITQIVFSDADGGYTDRLMLSYSGRITRVIEFMAGEGENGYSLRIEDVDNMIKALQKAKALWSEE